MVHSVEVVFDPQTEATVRGLWDALRDNGIPSQSPAARPHATLAVAQRIDGRVDAALGSLAGRFPLPGRLGATLIMGRSAGVLARLVVPTAELIELQAEVYGRCMPFVDPAPLPHTEPGQWTPHVTLARHVAPAKLTAALRIAGRPAEIAGTVIGLRHWDGDRRVEQRIC